MDDAKAEVLAFTSFPHSHWPKVWSIDPLERVNKEIPVLDWAGPAATTVAA